MPWATRGAKMEMQRHETEGQEEQQAGSELLSSVHKKANPPFKKSHSLQRPQHGGSGITPKRTAMLKGATLADTLATDQNALSR